MNNFKKLLVKMQKWPVITGHQPFFSALDMNKKIECSLEITWTNFIYYFNANFLKNSFLCSKSKVQYFQPTYTINKLIRVQQLAYTAYVTTPTFIDIHIISDMRMLTRMLIFSLWFFRVFKIFLVLTILHCLKSYSYISDL